MEKKFCSNKTTLSSIEKEDNILCQEKVLTVQLTNRICLQFQLSFVEIADNLHEDIKLNRNVSNSLTFRSPKIVHSHILVSPVVSIKPKICGGDIPYTFHSPKWNEA